MASLFKQLTLAEVIADYTAAFAEIQHRLKWDDWEDGIPWSLSRGALEDPEEIALTYDGGDRGGIWVWNKRKEAWQRPVDFDQDEMNLAGWICDHVNEPPLRRQFRVTRPGMYPPGSSGHSDTSAREGHYYYARTPNQAKKLASFHVPNEPLDVELWKEEVWAG